MGTGSRGREDPALSILVKEMGRGTPSVEAVSLQMQQSEVGVKSPWKLLPSHKLHPGDISTGWQPVTPSWRWAWTFPSLAGSLFQRNHKNIDALKALSTEHAEVCLSTSRVKPLHCPPPCSGKAVSILSADTSVPDLYGSLGRLPGGSSLPHHGRGPWTSGEGGRRFLLANANAMSFPRLVGPFPRHQLCPGLINWVWVTHFSLLF